MMRTCPKCQTKRCKALFLVNEWGYYYRTFKCPKCRHEWLVGDIQDSNPKTNGRVVNPDKPEPESTTETWYIQGFTPEWYYCTQIKVFK